MEIQKYKGIPPAETVAINEGKGVQIVHADSVTPTLNVILTGSGSMRSELSRDYFNLIIGYDPFPSDHIRVDKDRALTEYITDSVAAEFGGWTAENIEKIKKLPALISQERDGTEEQQAVFAFITDIRKQENGIKVYFQKYYPVPVSLPIMSSRICSNDAGFRMLTSFRRAAAMDIPAHQSAEMAVER